MGRPRWFVAAIKTSTIYDSQIFARVEVKACRSKAGHAVDEVFASELEQLAAWYRGMNIQLTFANFFLFWIRDLCFRRKLACDTPASTREANHAQVRCTAGAISISWLTAPARPCKRGLLAGGL